MMNLSELSNNLTFIITKDLDFNEEKKEIIAYAIETTIHAVLGTVLLIVVAFIMGTLKPTLIAAAFGFILRKFSGGAHFNTPTKCSVFGALIYTAIGFIALKVLEYSLYNDLLLWAILGLSLVIVGYLAPVDSENKPIHSRELRNKLRGLSIAFVLLSIFIITISMNPLLSVSICLGILYQALTLLPIFNR